MENKALEYESKTKKFRNEEIFQDNQMVYLLAPHASALQTNTTKFKQDFIGPLFIDTALDNSLQIERCHWTPIGQHISREPYQERFSVHPFRYSRQI